VYTPSPRLELGLALSSYLSSSIDSSDGLAICLHTIAAVSGVGMKIGTLPCHRAELEKFARRNGYVLDDLVLYGGEEYEIVGTIDKKKIDEAQRVAASIGEELFVIGETTRGPQIESSGGRIQRKGWIHLA